MECKSGSLVGISGDKIKEAVELIPEDTDKVELLEMLNPAFHELATMNKAKIEAYLRHVIKPRFGLTEREIDGYRESINELRDRNSGKSEVTVHKPEQKVEYIANFDGLVDLVEEEGKTAFLVKDGNELLIRPQVQIDGVEYLPPPKEKIPWLMCQGREIVKLYETSGSISDEKINSDLYDDLWHYHTEVSELPEGKYYDLIAAWDFHTYLTELVQCSPIICFHAIPERGKSRTGKGMIYVAHRGVHIESVREAHILRIANDLRASILFDVRAIWKKAAKEGSDDILLHRFERGLSIARVLYPERGRHKDTVYFDVFGPTVVATNEPVDKILDTRAVIINMPEAGRDFEDEIKPEDGLALKARLTVFRARQMGRPLPEVPKPAKARLGDILRPIAQIMELVRPERKEAFMQLVAKLVKRRGIEKTESLGAKLVSTVVSLRSEVERGILPQKLITEAVNEGKTDRFKYSPQRIGRELSALGFEKGTTGSGAAAIVWDDDYIDRLKESYNLPQTSVTSETSETQDE